MSIAYFVRLTCNMCKKTLEFDQVDVKPLREWLGDRGWTSEDGPNDKIRDLCPDCQ